MIWRRTMTKTLFRYVQNQGGISSAKLKTIGYTAKETFIQNGLLGVFRKHGRAIDDMATELIGMGIIADCPDDMPEGDWLMQCLIDERAGIDVLISRIEDTDYILELEEKRALNELREEMRLDGKSEEEIKRAIDDIPDDQEEEGEIEKLVEDPERDKIIIKTVFHPVKMVHTVTMIPAQNLYPLFFPVLRFYGHTLIRGHTRAEKEGRSIPEEGHTSIMKVCIPGCSICATFFSRQRSIPRTQFRIPRVSRLACGEIFLQGPHTGSASA